jgi:hypothetical protein
MTPFIPPSDLRAIAAAVERLLPCWRDPERYFERRGMAFLDFYILWLLRAPATLSLSAQDRNVTRRAK